MSSRTRKGRGQRRNRRNRACEACRLCAWLGAVRRAVELVNGVLAESSRPS